MADKKETKAPAKKAPAKKVTKAVEPVTAKAPAKMGRPTDFTEKTKENIYALVKAGCSYPTAAMTSGISKQSMYNWINRGVIERNRIQAGLEPIPEEADFLDFLDSVERKKEEFIATQVTAISKAGASGNIKAAMWLLEKARPEEYGDSRQIVHTGSDNGNVKVSVNIGDLESKIQMVLSKRNKPLDE